MITPLTIELTKSEMVMGAECGIARNIISTFEGRTPAHDFKDDTGWEKHIEGACGEIAVAKVLGRYWNRRINTFKGADIGYNIQVRTRTRHEWELYVRPDENMDHVWVLVTGIAPVFVVRGYIAAGRDAQRPEWYKDHGGRPFAWFVPQSELLDIENLKAQAL